MAAPHVLTMDQIGPAVERFAEVAIPMLYRELRRQIAVSLFVKLQDLSPVKTGKYKASHIPSAGSIQTRVLPDLPSFPIPGEHVVDSVLANAAPEVSIFIANAAAPERSPSKSYAALLETRRQYSRRRTQRAQFVGSAQAPDGIYGPAVRAIQALRATIVARVIQNVAARL